MMNLLARLRASSVSQASSAKGSRAPHRLYSGVFASILLCSLGACSGSSGASKPNADALAVDGSDTGANLQPDTAEALIPTLPDGSIDNIGLPADAGTHDRPVDALPQPADTALNDAPGDTPSDRGSDTMGGLDVSSGTDVARTDTPAFLDSATTDGPQIDVVLDTALPEAGADVPPPQPSVVCSQLGPLASDVSQRLCFDFSNASDATNFTPEAGTWSVADASYHGVGPSAQVTCPVGGGSGMTTSVLTNLSATDVRVHAKLTSLTVADKVLVLRSRPSGNRIELNFRSNYLSDTGATKGGDLVIDALVNCNYLTYVDVNTIQIPHALGQPIAVDVQLRGQRLTVSVNGKQVYDAIPSATDADGGTLLLPTDPGSVGLGVFMDGEDVFDDLVVEVLK